MDDTRGKYWTHTVLYKKEPVWESSQNWLFPCDTQWYNYVCMNFTVYTVYTVYIE